MKYYAKYLYYYTFCCGNDAGFSLFMGIPFATKINTPPYKPIIKRGYDIKYFDIIICLIVLI